MNPLYIILPMIPILAFFGLYMLRKWKYVYFYAFFNSLIFTGYLYVTLFSEISFFKEDELGLKRIYLFLYCLTAHVIANFMFALTYKFKLSKKWESTAKS